MSKADDAKAVLKNQAFKDAFLAVREQMVVRQESGRLTQEEELESIRTLKNLKRLENYLIRLLNDEKVKEFNLKNKKRFF